MKEKGYFFILAGFAVLLGMAIMAWTSDRAAAMPLPGPEAVSIMAGTNENGTKHYVYVIDSRELRLCVYSMKDDGKLYLLAARNLNYDMQIPLQFNCEKNKYKSAEDVKKDLERGKKKGSSKKP